MHIGWLVETLGVYGSVREMVEISNALIRRGHAVTLYTPGGEVCAWLPSLSKMAPVSQIDADGLDILIGMTHWRRPLHAIIDASKVPVKVVCIMGFAPSDDPADKLVGRIPLSIYDNMEMFRDTVTHAVLADSSWQWVWLQEYMHIDTLPPFAGVNLNMFRPVKVRRDRPPYYVVASGDPRRHKGSEVVSAAMRWFGADVRFDTYWGKGIPQDKMRDFLSNADIFLDAQRHGGWNNPVAEAMACGHAAVVCTDIPANSDFAIDGETVLVVPVDNAAAMGGAVIRLLNDEGLRRRLVRAAYSHIQQFSYDNVVLPFEAALRELVYHD